MCANRSISAASTLAATWVQSALAGQQRYGAGSWLLPGRVEPRSCGSALRPRFDAELSQQLTDFAWHERSIAASRPPENTHRSRLSNRRERRGQPGGPHGRLRSTKLRRNSVQNVSSSEPPTSTPSTSRQTSARVSVAITTAFETTWRFSQA